MLKSWPFLVFLILFLCSLSAWAQAPSDQAPVFQEPSEQLFSPSVAQRFYEIAYELAQSLQGAGPSEDIRGPKVEQAVTFLTATTALDSGANHIHPVLIKLAAQHSARDYSQLVYNSLARYLDKSADFEPARKAVLYLLERLNVREQREQLLKFLLSNLGGKNACFDSELTTLLGLLVAEKTDTEAAQFYFMRAFNNNNYNKLAFEKLLEIAPQHIEPATHLGYLRLALGQNPLDLEAALAFAQYTERLQLYQTATDAYEYCAGLFSYLYPSQQLPSYIYLPWMLSSYNTPRNQHRCLQIASQFRRSGRFDLFAEAVAGKAAEKIGDTEQANQIFQAAEEKALGLVGDTYSFTDYSSQIINYEQLAWFYCFASPDANQAIDWANKAYSIEPNSPTAAAILAYSLMMNEQIDWAKLLTDNYEHNQIADLALAQIQLAQGQRDLAIETLKAAIATDPGSLVAEHAKQILAQNGGEYVPTIDPDKTLAALRSSFGQTLVPTFIRPEKIIAAQLNVRGSEFSYGSKLDGTVAITNNSSEPLVISDDALFTGKIRIDANLTGDLNRKLPNLVSTKVRLALPIKPGSSIFVPLPLLTGELRQLLLTHPQASVDIEFTLYLDPVTNSQGQITNHLQDLKPAKLIVKRPGIEISDRRLRNQISSLTNGMQGQKIKTAKLFTGLLAEQNAMANREPFYKFMDADWMPTFLKSALVDSLTDNDWTTKVNIMADMTYLPLDFELMNALSENLNDTHWPVRLIAVYLLAKNSDTNFDKVLDWTAKYDSSELVRNMAIALGGAAPPPPPVEEPTSQPTQARPQQLPQPNI